MVDPIIGVFGEFTTYFRTHFSGWIESDVHRGYDLGFEKPMAIYLGSQPYGPIALFNFFVGLSGWVSDFYSKS